MEKKPFLLETIKKQSSLALSAGALVPIVTSHTVVTEQDIPFVVHLAKGLEKKQQAAKKAGGEVKNPLLNYEKELFVADISASHFCLLNKYYIKPYHILVVTRRFEQQQSLLTRADFEALWYCMAGFPSLGFYNSSPEAGASQRHKHLQVIPLPLTPHITSGNSLYPLESSARAAVDGAEGKKEGGGKIPVFSFNHALKDISAISRLSPAEAAGKLYEVYRELLAGTASESGPALDGSVAKDETFPYNMIITDSLMMIVRRKSPGFGGISVNALGFAGTFLVKNEKQFDFLARMGPLKVLHETAL